MASPIGPINSGDIVSLMLNDNGFFYIATYDGGGTNDIAFQWLIDTSKSLNTSLNDNNIMRFKVSGTYNEMTFEVVNTLAAGRRLYYKIVNGVRIMSVSQPVSASNTIALVTEYTSPPPPGVMYSAVGYAPVTVDTKTTISVVGYDFSVATPIVMNTDIYAIPTTFHIKSSGDASSFTCSTAVSNPLLGMKIFFCTSCQGLQCGAAQICKSTGEPVPQTAWTRVSDCQIDNKYSYCKSGQSCGSCYGPCSVSHESCLHATGNQFTCATQPPIVNPIVPLGPSGRFQPIVPSSDPTLDRVTILPYTIPVPTSQMMAIVVVVIVVLIIIMALVAYSYSSSTPPVVYSTSQTVTRYPHYREQVMM